MRRRALNTLLTWLNKKDRKPLIIRGARQVGKTWLVRELAKKCKKQVIEINFEKNLGYKDFFSSNNPYDMISIIEVAMNVSIDPSDAILFLDEVQVVPEILSKLRWFAEEMPHLPVIATGSLLDFVLNDHKFSMPVGRISYLYLEPFSFEEFLEVTDNDKLLDYIHAYEFGQNVPDILHQQLLDLLKYYRVIGGMPAVLGNWVDNRSLLEVNQIQHDLLTTYIEDFAKYPTRIMKDLLNDVMKAVPNLLGKKCKYSLINADVKSDALKNAIDLLGQARLVHKIIFTDANSVPLAAQTNNRYFKLILNDIGLAMASMGGVASDNIIHTQLSNEGGLSEQFVGQQIRTLDPFHIDPKLFYWTNPKYGSEAEVDYVIQYQHHIVPVEVKSGSSGHLRSLHSMMSKKNHQVALRFNADVPSVTNIQEYNYTLVSLPQYMVGQTYRLLESVFYAI